MDEHVAWVLGSSCLQPVKDDGIPNESQILPKPSFRDTAPERLSNQAMVPVYFMLYASG
jgi:hypothetical protein